MQNKKARGIILANNWKKKEFDTVLILRDEMIAKKIDNQLINEFIDEQYERINSEYQERIERYNEKKNNDQNKIINEIKKKRKKAINFLLLNKKFLEDKGASPEYIKNYVDSQYKKINERYSNND